MVADGGEEEAQEIQATQEIQETTEIQETHGVSLINSFDSL